MSRTGIIKSQRGTGIQLPLRILSTATYYAASLRAALSCDIPTLWCRVKIAGRERHTLYRLPLFILAYRDKAHEGPCTGSRSRVNCDRKNADEANMLASSEWNTLRDLRQVTATVGNHIQGHITVSRWHSVSNTSLEMMRADEHTRPVLPPFFYIRIIHSRTYH